MSWDPKQVVVIANPAAAGGRVGRDKTQVTGLLERNLGAVRIAWTTGPQDAPRLAREAVEGGATVVCSLGGDGTHGAVVSGIMAASPAPGAVALGILPAGTGGDFRRILRHGDTLETAAAAMPTAASGPLDVGRISWTRESGGTDDGHFINIASFGIGGLVDRLVNESSKRLGGQATFYIATVRALLRYQPARLRLHLDDEVVETGPITNVCVCNSRYAGGGMMFAPDARIDDGLLDIVVMRHRSIAHVVGLSGAIYKGKHVDDATVSVHRSRTLRAELIGDDPAWMDIDGEAPGVAPCTAEALPGALRLLDVRPEVLSTPPA